MRLLVVIVNFYINFVIVCIVFCRMINFVEISRICDVHRNLKFNWIFNILMSIFEITVCFFSVTMTIMSNFLEIHEKWINLCFCSFNFALCVLIYCSHLLYIRIKIRQFFVVDSLYAKMLTSSTKSWKLICNLMSTHKFNNFAL